MLLVVATGFTGCARVKARAHEAADPGGGERQNAALLVGSATFRLDQCKVAEAREPLEHAIAFYEGHSWLFDPGYARALIARARFRQFSSDNAAAASDFEKALFILSRHEPENLALILAASAWHLDCYDGPDKKERQKAIIERALDRAARSLKPLASAKFGDMEGFSNALLLLLRYELVVDEASVTARDAAFAVRRWKWGQPWDPGASHTAEQGDKWHPPCRLPERLPDLYVVARALRPKLQGCLRAAATRDASLRGVTRVWMHIAADGTIPSVRGVTIGIPAECNECITRAFAGVHFKPPIGGSLNVEAPIVYIGTASP